jgi:dihydropteroate synthase
MIPFRVRVLSINSLADAEQELGRIGADPGGTIRMAPKMLTRCIHLSDLQCRQANILKQEMLSLGGDAAVARGTVACSIDSTDVILIGTESQLHQLCKKLAPQPFGLPGLAGELTGLLKRITLKPQLWRTSQRDIPLNRPLIMGILNITPDSFSDGSCYLNPKKALDRALQMIDEGADIIDIGGESTRPGAEAVDVKEEIRRVLPIVNELSGKVTCPVSVDTRKNHVAKAVITAGAEIINDVSGLTFDPLLAPLIAASKVGVVLMHSRGTPDNMQQDTNYKNLIGEIFDGLRSLRDRANIQGINNEYIAIDPGIGFAKTAAGNLEILRRLSEFTSLGQPLLIGSSRKSFIGSALGRETGDRLYGTAATVATAVTNGASIIRVHDVRAMRDVADMAHAIATPALKG